MKILSILLLSVVQLLQSNNTVNLTFVGDAMQHAPQITAAQQADGTYDYSPCFQYLKDDIAWADLAVVNLEAGEGCAGLVLLFDLVCNFLFKIRCLILIIRIFKYSVHE